MGAFGREAFLITGMKRRLKYYLAGMAGVIIDTMLTRIDHHKSPVDWFHFQRNCGRHFDSFPDPQPIRVDLI